jgi:RNA polymerase sigma factor (sigma-70 family)
MSSTVKKPAALVPATGSVDNASNMEASAATRPTRPAPRVPARLLRLASDERLVEHVRGGSEAAFEAIFDRHHRGILAFCRHMLGSPEEAEDAVQHTFMAAYRNIAGSRRAIQLRPWLYTIARNRCLSVLRARRERPVEDLDELATENLAAEVQRREDLRDLLRDVGGLPEDQRAALVLAEVGGVSHDEIAQVLGVQREKVKALVFQARSSLIASRAARETPCDEIRLQLSELRGGALRRNTLRRHLKTCAGCREFRAALRDQRKMLAVALPVVPTLALKQGVMAAALESSAAAAGGAAAGSAAGAAAGGSLLAGGGAAATAKVLAIAVLVGGGAAGVKAVAPGEQAASPVPAPAGDSARERATPAVAEPRRAAPAAVGRGGAQQPSESGAGVRRRRSEERSKGRRGIERRSARANERAAGPQPDHGGRPAKKINARALERRDARGPSVRSQGGSNPSAALPAPKPREPKAETPVKPEQAPEPQKPAKPAASPPPAEPEAAATVAPEPEPDGNAYANGKAKK